MGVRKTTTNTAAYGSVSDLFIPHAAVGAFTLFGWCKIPTSEAAKFCVLGGGGNDVGTGGSLMRIRNNAPFNQIGFYNSNDAPEAFRSATNQDNSCPLDVWFSYCGVVSGGIITHYRNGSLLTTTGPNNYTAPIGPVHNAFNYNFWRWNRSAPLHGDAQMSGAEFAYWDQALTPTDIANLQTSRPNEIGNTPLAYYSMEDLGDFANKGSGAYANIALNTPGDFANDDHPYAIGPVGVARKQLNSENDLLELGTISGG